MGPNETTLKDVVVYNSETGERVMGFDLVSCPDITCETVVVSNSPVKKLYGESIEFTANITYPKFSRKRFVKKLMAVGVSRNVANRYAKFCALTRSPYGQQWTNLCWMAAFG